MCQKVTLNHIGKIIPPYLFFLFARETFSILNVFLRIRERTDTLMQLKTFNHDKFERQMFISFELQVKFSVLFEIPTS